MNRRLRMLEPPVIALLLVALNPVAGSQVPSPFQLAGVSSNGRGFVAVPNEAQGSTRILEVDGLHIVGEWEVGNFRARLVRSIRGSRAFLSYGVLTTQSDHFVARLYSREGGGDLELRWTSESLPTDIRSGADIGVSETGLWWYAARTHPVRTLAVGAVGSDSPEWQWTDARGESDCTSEGTRAYFLGDSSKRVIVEWDCEIGILEAERGLTQVLQPPSECAGGVGQVRVGKEAVWASCATFAPPKELNDASPKEVSEWLYEESLAVPAGDLHVAYPLDSLDAPILFMTDSVFPGAVTTLWVGFEGEALVNAHTGQVRGLRLDVKRRRVVPSDLNAMLDKRFISDSAPSSAPFLDVGWNGGALVDLDSQGGVVAFTSLSKLAAERQAPGSRN